MKKVNQIKTYIYNHLINLTDIDKLDRTVTRNLPKNTTITTTNN